jgi:peptide/nickel transport system ATP-binding protein
MSAVPFPPEAAGADRGDGTRGRDGAAEVLAIDRLTTRIGTRGPAILESVSLSIAAGEIVGVVGESGSGKSMLALSVMGLLPYPIRLDGGGIRLAGRELAGRPAAEVRAARGGDMAMIFQEPMTSLNPVMRVGRQIEEVLRFRRGLAGAAARARAIELLGRVEIPDPAERIDAFPHELSGGMRQRVMIAMALAGEPKLLIADEPTTALDVTIQAQILELIRKLRRDGGMAVLLITHDLGVIAEMCDRVAVMYAGRIIETAVVDVLFDSPAHPYTRGLLGSRPRIDRGRERLATIEGSVPPVGGYLPGCRFAPRCPSARDACSVEPPMRALAAGHHVACHEAFGFDLPAAGVGR